MEISWLGPQSGWAEGWLRKCTILTPKEKGPRNRGPFQIPFARNEDLQADVVHVFVVRCFDNRENDTRESESAENASGRADFAFTFDGSSRAIKAGWVGGG